MKVAVVGLWHLGLVTAACLAEFGNQVMAYDDAKIINQLNLNYLPIFEPGLNELIHLQRTQNRLIFTHELIALKEADIFWITYDTPVDDQDLADIEAITKKICDLFPFIKNNTTVIISSQLPVGTTRLLQKDFQKQYPDKAVYFVCSPENLRLGKAIQVFTTPDRIVMGIDHEAVKSVIEKIIAPIRDKIIWMSIESAEMTKHAINSFLALSVTFTNELAVLCEKIGANAKEVEKGLKSEERIGYKAYLKPGAAFAGGTLARDVNYLVELGKKEKTKTYLLSAMLESNEHHKKWIQHKLKTTKSNLHGAKVVVLGLTYKPGTDTLRRSAAIELCLWLNQQGAQVYAYDPVVKKLPPALEKIIHLENDPMQALNNAKAAVIATEWPELKTLAAEDFVHQMKEAFVYDINGFLQDRLASHCDLNYFYVGGR